MRLKCRQRRQSAVGLRASRAEQQAHAVQAACRSGAGGQSQALHIGRPLIVAARAEWHAHGLRAATSFSLGAATFSAKTWVTVRTSMGPTAFMPAHWIRPSMNCRCRPWKPVTVTSRSAGEDREVQATFAAMNFAGEAISI